MSQLQNSEATTDWRPEPLPVSISEVVPVARKRVSVFLRCLLFVPALFFFALYGCVACFLFAFVSREKADKTISPP